MARREVLAPRGAPPRGAAGDGRRRRRRRRVLRRGVVSAGARRCQAPLHSRGGGELGADAGAADGGVPGGEGLEEGGEGVAVAGADGVERGGEARRGEERRWRGERGGGDGRELEVAREEEEQDEGGGEHRGHVVDALPEEHRGRGRAVREHLHRARSPPEREISLSVRGTGEAGQWDGVDRSDSEAEEGSEMKRGLSAKLAGASVSSSWDRRSGRRCLPFFS